MSTQAQSSTQSVSAEPTYSFDAQLSKVTENGKFVTWQYSMPRNSFPTSQLSAGSSHTFVLDKVKYANSFGHYTQLLEPLGMEVPEGFYTYTVSATEDTILVKGMTESTVRIAVVDLVTTSNSKSLKVMMVARPPVSFRVYEQQSVKEPDEEFTGFTGLFPDADGDY